MDKFSKLFEKLDSTFSTNEKVDLMKDYFQSVSPAEGAWALFFLSGRRLKRLVGVKLLRDWGLELIQIPDWLFQESYSTVGDTAETVTLLLRSRSKNLHSHISLDEWMNKRILPLKGLSDEQQKELITNWWLELPTIQSFILNKLLTGSFRVGISELLTVKALEKAFNMEHAKLMLRLQGEWEPTAEFFKSLINSESHDLEHRSQPYPFCLSYALDKELESLGTFEEWLPEWKWDGIRAQILYRENICQIWSRGNELITHQFPELILPETCLGFDFVVDGEILAYQNGRPLSFNVLQNRLGRKKLTPQLIEKHPVVFMAFDLLEWKGEDIRSKPLHERREILSAFLKKLPDTENYYLSQHVEAKSWEELTQQRLIAKEKDTEGIMLKRLSSAYGVGRKKGDWWKFKVDPYTIDAVLIYAQPGSGIRANLYTDYTFAVWDGDVLTPIAKAYSGLSKEEINELDKWIRKNTEDKFGPVRQVKPHYVFEIAFEGIQESKRHKSGVALRFPRIQRWRKDKTVDQADKLKDIKTNLLKIPKELL